ncbi:hypothetical protein [Nonomuraea zeae]|uniref:Uncharacterized protein n=1 Tax=Nonomuraea zeae TaxID=1642303 RepID=A0A5S4FL65_9ACTN|nr:hypothetical protein [Nonomuraea zeae]TMR21467.1 hypothetical protein ETD85_50835 [Nonomuraea zeae]
MIQVRRWMAASVGTLGLLTFGVVTAPNASASSAIPGDVATYSVKVTGTINSAYNPREVLATCSADIGGTCAITRSYSATRTFQVALGVSVKVVAAELGWSSSSTTTVAASCTSRKFTSNRQIYRGYPRGTRKWYTVTKSVYNVYTKKVRSTSTSAPKQAFNPNGVRCIMETR